MDPNTEPDTTQKASPSAAPEPNPAAAAPQSPEPPQEAAPAPEANPAPQSAAPPPAGAPTPQDPRAGAPPPTVPTGPHPGAMAAAAGQPMPHPAGVAGAPPAASQTIPRAPAPQPDPALQQLHAEQVAQQESMRRMMEEAQAMQRRTAPWVQLLIQRLGMEDPLAQDLVTDIAHSAAQLTRYIADELRRAGHGQTAMAAFQHDTFAEVCHAFLQQPMAMITQAPGPQYWMDYMNGLVVTDLGAREERVSAANATMADMRTQNPAQPPRDDRVATFGARPGRKPRTPGTPA